MLPMNEITVLIMSYLIWLPMMAAQAMLPASSHPIFRIFRVSLPSSFNWPFSVLLAFLEVVGEVICGRL
jgi:hypothetical protein